jgi:hypothetical protein
MYTMLVEKRGSSESSLMKDEAKKLVSVMVMVWNVKAYHSIVTRLAENMSTLLKLQF